MKDTGKEKLLQQPPPVHGVSRPGSSGRLAHSTGLPLPEQNCAAGYVHRERKNEDGGEFQVPESVEMVQLLLAGIHFFSPGTHSWRLRCWLSVSSREAGVGMSGSSWRGAGVVGWGDLWQSHSLLQSGMGSVSAFWAYGSGEQG